MGGKTRMRGLFSNYVNNHVPREESSAVLSTRGWIFQSLLIRIRKYRYGLRVDWNEFKKRNKMQKKRRAWKSFAESESRNAIVNRKINRAKNPRLYVGFAAAKVFSSAAHVYN